MKRSNYPKLEYPGTRVLTPEDTEQWDQSLASVLRPDQPERNILTPVDEPNLDSGAYSFRRPSAQQDPVPAPKPTRLYDDAKAGKGKRVRTSVSAMESNNYGLPRMKKISENDDAKGRKKSEEKRKEAWHLPSDSDEEETEAERDEFDSRKASRHAREMPPKNKNYFNIRQKSQPQFGSDYTNNALVTGDEMEKKDFAAIASHRVDPHSVPPAMRRSRAASYTPGLEVTKMSYNAFKERLEKDKIAKGLFIEMDVLKEDEWQEQARWIKFEEDLLEGADRWGNPHISSLSFHSLINLRLCLEKCTFLLDLQCFDYSTVVYHLVDEFGRNYDLSEETKVEVLRSLFLPHKYVDAPSNTGLHLGGIRRRMSRSATRPSIQLPDNFLATMMKRNSSANVLDKSGKNEHLSIYIDDNNSMPTIPSFSDLQRMANSQRRDSIMNRMEEGTEGTMALVGSLKSIEKPLVAVVRLASAAVMPNLMEVPVPVRFFFVLFTPEFSPNLDYHEVGRSFCTLMSHKPFQKVAFTMDDRQDMLNSINNFLDETVVLPPGDWDKKNLLSMSEIQELKRKKRIRMETMEKLKKGKISFKKKDSEAKKIEMSLSEKKDEGGDGKEEEDPLKRTNVPFGGCIKEICGRYPKYWSDIKDGCNVLCIATILYIFFAVVASAITFGGLWGIKTDGLIGIPETLLVSSAIGCLFALFSCQPLVIVGVTGPLMVFDEALYKFSLNSEVEFLTWRTWISFWVILIALTVACFQGSFVVKFFTSFTKDIFAMFIASIYIAEALHNTIESFEHHPTLTLPEYCNASAHPTHSALTALIHSNITSIEDLADSHSSHAMMDNDTMFGLNDTHDGGHSAASSHGGGHHVVPQPNTAFKTFILQYFTYIIAYSLKLFKTHHALGRGIRRTLGDFAVPISVAVMIGIDQAFPRAFTEKLNVPEGLELTSPEKRDWFINPMGIKENVPIWIPFVSVLPAILVYLLLFMETSISELILMDKLKKGRGVHWDIVLLSLCNSISGLFGGPWICAATVRAMSHLAALTVMSTTHAPGETPKIVDIKDQRVTGFIIYLMVGLAILISPALRYIPSSCLFGIFLYMGTYSLHGIQFWDRLCLVLMPVKYHPHVEYVKRVRTWRMHLYTLLQSIGFISLWVVRSTSATLAFPFFVVGMIPYRLSFRFIFSKQELDALDGPNADKVFKDDEQEEPYLAH